MSTVRLRACSPVASSSTRARSANASIPKSAEELVGGSQLARARRSAGARAAATRRRPGALAPGRAGGGSARGVRSPRGRAARRRRPGRGAPVTALRRPVPTACRWRSSIRSSTSSAATACSGGRSGSRPRSARPIANVENQSSRGSPVASRGGEERLLVSARGRCAGRRRPSRQRHAHALAAGGRSPRVATSQPRQLVLATPERGQRQRAVAGRCRCRSPRASASASSTSEAAARSLAREEVDADARA